MFEQEHAPVPSSATSNVVEEESSSRETDSDSHMWTHTEIFNKMGTGIQSENTHDRLFKTSHSIVSIFKFFIYAL